MTTQQQIRAALDGTFIAMHFSGRLIALKVPADFDPFSPAGEKTIRRANEQKVVEA